MLSLICTKSSLMFSLLERLICSQTTGEDDAILVISLNPPAASCFKMPSSVSIFLTVCTSSAAIICGTWLIAAVKASWRFASSRIVNAPSSSMKDVNSFTFSVFTFSVGVIK